MFVYSFILGIIENLKNNITVADIKTLSNLVSVSNGTVSEKVTDMLVSLSSTANNNFFELNFYKIEFSSKIIIYFPF